MKLGKILGFSLLSCTFHAQAGQEFDFQLEPSSADNFLEAAFRFINPNPEEIPQRILVYVPGTDGDARDVVNDPTFLDACRQCHAALIGCYFRGEGLSYDNPIGGSGRALDEALASFAAQTKQLHLARLPLLLMGFSEGSQFTFNYACWHPDRIEAFAAIKAGGFALSPQEESFRIPGLFVAGQYDEPGRIRATSQAFTKSAGKNSRWAFLFEKGAGHDMTHIGSFALQFLHAVCENPGGGVYRHPDNGEASSLPSKDASLCWFPNRVTAESWASLHQPKPLAELLEMPDPVAAASVFQVAIAPPTFTCANGERQEGTISLATSQEAVSVQNISISGPGFALAGAIDGKAPLQTILSFAPVDSDWGPVSAEVTISAQRSGHELTKEIITLHGIVQGPVTPVPQLLYLGATHPMETIVKTIRLEGSGARVAKVMLPPNITAAVEKMHGTDELLLRVAWTPSTRLGSMSGDIRLDLDEPQKGTLRIPILGVVVRP